MDFLGIVGNRKPYRMLTEIGYVAFVTERRVASFGSVAARLLRAYATQVEVLRRLRHGGHQYVRVEHIHINEGGQAVIANVKAAPTPKAEGRRFESWAMSCPSDLPAEFFTRLICKRVVSGRKR
jgi:hypothetical protein